LVPYVYFRFQFGHFRQFRHMWQIVAYVDRHMDTCPIETVLMTKLAERTNLYKRSKRK
jgi:hypothetical protein